MSEITPHDARVTLRAGGVAPLATKFPEDERASPLGAHAYVHPALAGRVVVRLSPAAVAAGTDAEMDALGFAKDTAVEDLGLVRYRTLGFPAWALVHDPKKARFALEVTQDFRKAKKRAASKPGHAREAFEEIGKRLQRTVPHFLPSFWEEAGRVLADEGSAAMAAQCFEKAREAERAHKLKVDADERDAVFLEFALLGALSAKTLSAYAKDLERSEGAKDAYRRFRGITVKRALGGLPPWSGMGKDLRGLAKAAKLDVDAEDDSLMRELVGTPAIGRAPQELWTTFRPSLVRIGKADAAMRHLIRGIFPTPKNDDDDKRKKLIEDWLALLDEIGAFADLPDAGLSEWLGKLIRWAGGAPRVVALLGELAPRLREPVAVVVKHGWWERLDLDLAEGALRLGIPLADPGDDDFDPDSISLACDPVKVAADPRYSKKLVQVVARMMGQTAHEPKMRGKEGFAAARRAWLEEQIADLEKGTLVKAEEALEELKEKTRAATFAPYPDLQARLAAARLEPALGRLLREGIFDELGWPAYEAATEKLGKDLELEGGFPWLVVRNERHATVLGPEGVVLEHDFVSNAKTESIEKTLFVDGQLFVEVRDKKSYDDRAYWSSAPKTRFEAKGTGWSDSGMATTLPDGSVTLGKRAFRAGDTELGWYERHAYDGTTLFTLGYQGGEWGWREYDPVKDKTGRSSRPKFFEEFVEAGKKLNIHQLELHPVAVKTSPLGCKDGFAGFRVRFAEGDDGLIEAERIDGVKLAAKGVSIEGLLSLPARDTPLPIEDTSGDLGEAAYLRTHDGELLADLSEHDWASRGFGTKLPPRRFWHYLTPRDPKASTLLRKLDDAAVAGLLAAAREDVAANDDDDRPLPKAEAAAKALGITSARLQRGVAGVAAKAAELEAELREVIEGRGEDAVDGEEAGDNGGLVLKADAAMKKGKAIVEDFEVNLPEWLNGGRGKAMRAVVPFAEASQRTEAREILTALAQTSFADDLANLRTLRISEQEDQDDDTEYNALRVVKVEGSTFAIHASDDWALERTDDGKFRAPPGFDVKDEKRPQGIGKAFVEAYLALGTEPTPFDPAHVDLVAARTGLTKAEAGLLLLGAPVQGYQRDFLGKEKREALGLKLAEAEAARGIFKDLKDGLLDQVFERAAADEKALTGAAWAERLGEAWHDVVGEKVQLPEGLVLEAQKDLVVEGSLGRLLTAVASPKAAAPLFELGKWTTLSQANSWISDPGEEGFDPQLARDLVLIMAWVSFSTPVGEPIRAGIPTLYEKLRATVSDPKLVWGLGNKYSNKKDLKDLKALLDLVKGKQVIHEKDDDDVCDDGRDTGVILLGKYGESLRGAFRPGLVQRWDDPVLVGLHKGLHDGDDDDDDGSQPIGVASLILGKDLAALAARIADSPVAAGGWEANPLLSTKKTVTAVEKANGVSTEAATLYLQLLALAEPTQKAVQKWNGWTPKQYAAAVAELVKKKLVVEGKRERAQREVFLPGGFGKGEGKNLPMEEWKKQFYPGFLPRNVPTEPLHALFARAWKKVEAGEGPRFEKVR